jgi:hypothetical protein
MLAASQQGRWNASREGPATHPYFYMSIQTIYFDEYGRKTGENTETVADLRRVPKRLPSLVEQVRDQWKGTQRRPARRDTRFQ